MKFFSEDRIILRELFRSHTPMQLYFFHEKYLLSPAQIGRVVNRLDKENLVDIVDQAVRLTESGRKWVLRHRHTIFSCDEASLYWKVPIVHPVEVGEGFYSPKMSKIAKQHLTIAHDEVKKDG